LPSAATRGRVPGDRPLGLAAWGWVVPQGLRRVVAAVFVLSTPLAVGATGSADAQTAVDAVILQTTLTGLREVGPDGALGAGDPDGVGGATVEVQATSLCARLDVTGIDLPATAAHVHRAPVGVNGDVVVPLTPPDARGRSEGCVDVEPALLAELADAPTDFYVNVHTAAFPAGAVRGQLQSAAGEGVLLATRVSGSEEVGPAGELDVGDVDGSGVATVAVSTAARRVCFEVWVHDVEVPATAAHIHRAPAGVNGPVVVPLGAPDGAGRAAGCVRDLDSALVADLTADPGSYYVNVHTTTFPEGAVRGQLAPASSDAASADGALDRALAGFVEGEEAAPGIAVVVQGGDGDAVLHTAGVADVSTGAPIGFDDHMRLASVAKAFSGAVALSVVADGSLALTETVGQRLPDLPAAWGEVTLAELLGHTSGIPDFSTTDAFVDALVASLLVAPPPEELLSFVADQPLLFPPGTEYRYSNSDNIVVGLMVQAATGRSYEEELRDRVLGPLGLSLTSLPNGNELPTPFVHGYDAADGEDVSELFAAGWTWASGGIVASPADANRFVRAYAAGATTDASTRAAQLTFVDGGSEPPGPGRNSAGLAIFRYETRCGTVYGHTGNTPGYTQFIAATADGSRSATVGINAQITPSTDLLRFQQLRGIFGLAVCAALAR
jgi:D-alanyl-D-alanine carboxypeptidase